MPQVPLLSMQGIHKRFPGVRALENIDFDLYPGEVHGLVGENGAGKSTLIKILSGVYTPDEGDILLDDQPVLISHPSDAQSLGISSVHQELHLEPYLTVAENIFLGHQPQGRFGFIDHSRMHQEALRLLDSLGVDIDPKRLVSELAVAHRQMVSIAHAVSVEARIVIMDEPTAPLTERETIMLFNIIRRLKESGIAVIFISHRLEEVFEIADRVTVLRDGQLIITTPVEEISLNQVISMMIGRSVSELFQKESIPIGDPILEVRNLYRRGLLENITFTLRQSEIVGLFGLAGAGRTDLARVLFGVESIDTGEIILNALPIRAHTPSQSIRRGIGLVPEDRRQQGLIVKQSVKANISLARLPFLTKMGIINSRSETKLARDYVDRLQVRTPSLNQQVMYLSGGNQQRVVIAKWLATSPKVLILDEPTKGIDIGAKAEIHALMSDLAKQCVSILMISSELPEILGMSDRIIVMHRGRITGEFSRDEVTEEKIMRAATGEAGYAQH